MSAKEQFRPLIGAFSSKWHRVKRPKTARKIQVINLNKAFLKTIFGHFKNAQARNYLWPK
ncbi:hypothetical protein GCM10009119_40310 [Algoriphagus jejuensis]|uniref:Transposase n=1 Tax=Algoriphagus jejuensis TaxID=419934 RepID=A0ABN1N568_9BACT